VGGIRSVEKDIFVVVALPLYLRSVQVCGGKTTAYSTPGYISEKLSGSLLFIFHSSLKSIFFCR
jgi:hypothetical protein